MSQKLSNAKKPSILVVDDTPENLRYLNELLSAQGYDVRATLDGQTAIDVAKMIEPNLILLDIKMPKMDGYMVSQALRENEKLEDTPIIFISALDEVEDKVRAFKAGGVDYITKPFEEQEVLARVDVHLQLYKSKKKVQALVKQQDYFTKKIMHEMNTPVSVIKLNAQSLEQEVGKKTQLDTIKASAKVLASIYDDLGYLVKKEHHEYEVQSIKLLEFVGKRISYFHEVAEVKSIHIDFVLDLEYRVEMNPLELERLVDNTLSNAIKYSHENTMIEILIGSENGKYVLSFQDQGIGIEETEKIFEHYYQEDHEKSGLGIGMTTVKEICDKYNIEVDILSTQGVGTVFRYYFHDDMVEVI